MLVLGMQISILTDTLGNNLSIMQFSVLMHSVVLKKLGECRKLHQAGLSPVGIHNPHTPQL